jgi:ribosomal protein S18 acetylase RimI-like enzyme
MTTRPAPAIRRARPGDVGALLDLERHFPGDRMSRPSLRRLLRRPSASVWVAQAPDRTLLGALILLTRVNTSVARIYSLVVAPQARGQGIAQRLVQAAERAARRGGRQTMSLEVRVDNQAARALYARLGYQEQMLLLDYYEDGAEGIRLRKALSR